MGTTMWECAAYACRECGRPVNPIINHCGDCGWDKPHIELNIPKSAGWSREQHNDSERRRIQAEKGAV